MWHFLVDFHTFNSWACDWWIWKEIFNFFSNPPITCLKIKIWPIRCMGIRLMEVYGHQPCWLFIVSLSALLHKNITNFIYSTLTLSRPNKLLSAKFLVCFNFQSASMSLRVGEMLSECQTAYIRMRCRVTWRLIQIQAVCIRYFSCDWRAKG